MIVDICTSIIYLITGASGTSGNSGNIYDGQLQAWKIPPSAFRPLKAIVDKFSSARRSSKAESNDSGSTSSMEVDDNNDETAGLLVELQQVLSSV